ncbi:hypothetical protein C8R43DRAFT_954223 [Mycena crocata]|nr:hypothetical protein C8R43DRAFT_954223 [Mycena crocata]
MFDSPSSSLPPNVVRDSSCSSQSSILAQNSSKHSNPGPRWGTGAGCPQIFDPNCSPSPTKHFKRGQWSSDLHAIIPNTILIDTSAGRNFGCPVKVAIVATSSVAFWGSNLRCLREGTVFRVCIFVSTVTGEGKDILVETRSSASKTSSISGEMPGAVTESKGQSIEHNRGAQDDDVAEALPQKCSQLLQPIPRVGWKRKPNAARRVCCACIPTESWVSILMLACFELSRAKKRKASDTIPGAFGAFCSFAERQRFFAPGCNGTTATAGLRKCSQCARVLYRSKTCQGEAWKLAAAPHKDLCKLAKLVADHTSLPSRPNTIADSDSFYRRIDGNEEMEAVTKDFMECYKTLQSALRRNNVNSGSNFGKFDFSAASHLPAPWNLSGIRQ